jgi:myo-inositol 2-dehydrogenase / D-chiro-inositol 1-dehydrogenase
LGAGRIGSQHAGLISGWPEVEAVLVGDIDIGRAKALAEKVGGEAGTVEEIIGYGLDAVVIAASTSAHAGLIRAAVEAGIPAFCEKPIAPGYEETREIVELVETTGAVLQVGFQRRFDAGYVAAKRLVDDGTLGTLYSVRERVYEAAEPFRSGEGYDVPAVCLNVVTR